MSTDHTCLGRAAAATDSSRTTSTVGDDRAKDRTQTSRGRPNCGLLTGERTNDGRCDVQLIARYRLGLVHEGCVPYDTTTKCDRPETAAPFLHRLLRTYDREVVGGLYLNSQNDAIGHSIAYIGTLTQALVEPRGILVPALLANAAGVIVFHNHPSGDPTPSSDDLALTNRLIEAGNIVGISVLDHIVLGDAPRYTSIRHLHQW